MAMLQVVLLLSCGLGCLTVNGCATHADYRSASPSSENQVNCPTIVSRSTWGARSSKSVSNLSSQPVPYVIIHHSASPHTCDSPTSCAAEVRHYQNTHMDREGKDDISYSFLIGGDGTIFEGRGWDKVGGHTEGYDGVALGFCLIGNFENTSPPSAQLEATQRLLECGVQIGKLRSTYTLKAHRDLRPTDCPGDKLYNIIRGWERY